MYKVLLADDEPFIREGIRDLLDWTGLGYEVAGVFGDGRQVLEYLQGYAADVVVTDIKMPFGTGLDIAKYVCDNHLHTRIILISGYREIDLAMAAIQYGVSQYILKPVDIQELEAHLKKIKKQLDQERKNRSNQFALEYYQHSIGELKNDFFTELATGSFTNELYLTNMFQLLYPRLELEACHCCEITICFSNYVEYLKNHWEHTGSELYRCLQNCILLCSSAVEYRMIHKAEDKVILFGLLVRADSGERAEDLIRSQVEGLCRELRETFYIEAIQQELKIYRDILEYSRNCSACLAEAPSFLLDFHEQEKLLFSNLGTGNPEKTQVVLRRLLTYLRQMDFSVAKELVCEMLTIFGTKLGEGGSRTASGLLDREKSQRIQQAEEDSYGNYTGEKNVWLEIRENQEAISATIPRKTLSIYMTVNYGQGSTGVIVFNIDWKAFCNMLDSGLASLEESLGIVDGDGRPLANVRGEGAQNLSPDLLRHLEKGQNYVSAGNQVLYLAPFSHSDWYYVLSVPLSVYQSGIASIRFAMVVAIAGGILVTILVAFLISLRIYRPFRRIKELLQLPVTYVNHRPAITGDEEAYILASIRSTIRENEKIGRELEKRISMLKKAQNIALQAQINPHFLYNTLDAINWMTMRLTGGKNDASVMIAKLAAMLRYSLEDPETMVCLGVELQNVRTYLELQELRYRGQFTVEWEIDESLLNCKVIKLILQPIVENSIYHGIRPLQSTGVIRICARQKAGALVLEIGDTGKGIPAKVLEQLNAALRKADIAKSEGHIGLQNVNQRIRLFFGDEYGVHVESLSGQWTRVKLSLPMDDGMAG